MKSKKNMHNVYDKSDVYFLYRYSTNSSTLIGNRNDLIKFLSNAFEPTSFLDDKRDFSSSYKWRNKYFENINMGRDYFHRKLIDIFENESGITYTKVTEYYYEREYLFFDGLERVIDVRDFLEEAFRYFVTHKDDYKSYRYHFRKRNHQTRHRHSINSFKHNPIKNKSGVRKFDSMLDSEYRDFHFKHIEDSNNPFPNWWDDTSRRVEGNWKSQYKVNKQHNIHKDAKDAKDDKSIRKDFFFDDFSIEEIEEMLRDDFCKN